MQVLTWTSGSGLFSSPAWEYATPMGHAHAAYVVVSSVVYHLSCKVRRPAIRNRTTHHNHTRENAPSPDSRAHMLTNSQRPHYHPAQHGMMENRIKHQPSRIAHHYLPTSRLSRAAADAGGGSGHESTASSTSSRNVLLLWTVVPPNTTRTPGELALTCATIFASS